MLRRLRTSLVLRFTLTIVSLSVVIIWIVGSALLNQLSNGIYKEKLNTSLADASATTRSTQLQLSIAQFQDKATVKIIVGEILAVPSVAGTDPGREIALFAYPSNTIKDQYSGTSNLMSTKSVSEQFRKKTRESKTIIWERTTLRYLSGQTEKVILVGNKLAIPNAGKYEIYVLYSLSQQSKTVDLISNALLLTGFILTLFIGFIAWIVLRQLTAPIRQAAIVAEELTRGDLDQRMDIRGEDEVAKLGYAFNEMAVTLKQQISRLENLSRLQQRFVADVSHELRTPLTTIRMASQVLYAGKDQYEPSVVRSIELLDSQINRFESLLTDLLEVSRFDAEVAVMETQAIDFVVLVKEAIDYVHPSQNRFINLEAPSHPVMIDADPRRIKRIVRNLLTNAIDHREDKEIELKIVETESEVALGVRDFGIGFTSKDRATLFDRFWRADPARARITGGTGLGLSIALEDTKLHQGTLDACGAPNKGANFVLTLPKFAGGSIQSHPISVVPKDFLA